MPLIRFRNKRCGSRGKRVMFSGLFRPMHLLLVLAIILLVFPTKVSELGGALGKTIGGFKKAMNDSKGPEGAEAQRQTEDTRS